MARKKSAQVRWIRQDITRLRLADRADAVTCHFDALNHVLDARSMQRIFVNVARILREGSLIMFDLNTAAMLRWLGGREKMFRVGRHVFMATNEFDPKHNIAAFHQTWFIAKGRLVEKREVTVRERAYADSDVQDMLRTAGLTIASVKTQREVDGQPARLLYTAIKAEAASATRRGAPRRLGA